MTYPGYLLNPGDMFQVEPERVMFATGARKSKRDSPGAQARAGEEEADMEESEDETLDEVEAAESEVGAATIEAAAESEDAGEKSPEQAEDAKKALKSLMVRARRILEESKTDLSAKRLQELRAFSKAVKKTLSKHGSKSAQDGEMTDTIENLESSLTAITSRMPAEIQATAAPAASSPTSAETPAPLSSNPQMQDPAKAAAHQARKDAELLHQALQRARENPVDSTKPYATPWRPRDYMSAFAFIPRYLEVNQNICSAVYLRHPVARPGLAEVPNPLHPETMGLAFNWYLRRR
jgi:ribosomal protein S4